MTVFLLGGAQTDFATHWSRDGHGAFEMMHAAIDGALENAGVDAGDLQVPGARVAQTLNIGGSCTTTVSFVLGVD